MSVHIEGQHPDAVEFLFEGARKRMPGAVVSSLAVHGAVVGFIVMGLHWGPTASARQTTSQARVTAGIVWIASGPHADVEHGGGGSGRGEPQPPGRVELPGRDRLTVPVERARAIRLQPAAAPPDAAPSIAQLDISALRTAAGAETLPGSIDGVPGRVSHGPGTGGGAGSGAGTGDGPGTGPGRGPGSGGNEGGGPMQPGVAGLQDPTAVLQVKPTYTTEAMRERIQGIVTLECVVRADGTVADVRVVRSLDPKFGLDREAARAASEWRFIPGRFKGQPVPVLVRIEMTFGLQ